MASTEYHVVGSTLSYVVSYLCTLSVANLFLADIKAFILVAYNYM